MFNGGGELALVLGAKTGAFGGDNFELSRSELTEQSRIFIINCIYFFLAGNANHDLVSSF